MNTVTQRYMETVQISDIPWHRLTTAYGRATDFPGELDALWAMESVDAVDEAGKKSWPKTLSINRLYGILRRLH